MRTVEWDHTQHKVSMIDQRQLPENLVVVAFEDYHQVAEAIRSMVVRGAPAIGAAAAFGMALAADRTPTNDVTSLLNSLNEAALVLRSARPTAVNLDWAVRRTMNAARRNVDDLQKMRAAVVSEALSIADEDVETNLRMARHGAKLLADGDTIIHHCNTGSLATVEWGTALGVIRMAYEQGKHLHVLVDETRPRLQGARLTAWELTQYGIPFEIISDNAAGYFLSTGQADKVLFGADRVAANGDVANKIGSYMLALAAWDNQVPVYCVAPTSTIDLSLASGEFIPIEERSPDEVLNISVGGQVAVPTGARARNPAFDITPGRLISGIVTELGVILPPFKKSIRQMIEQVDIEKP